jgi:4-hydroxythreonine-4-phosphate dehydrogenase
MTPSVPTLALTTGDAAGIGPEISLRVAAGDEARDIARLILVGDLPVLEQAKSFAGVNAALRAVMRDELPALLAQPPESGVIEVLSVGSLEQPVPLGSAGAAAGRASYDYIVAAIEEAKRGRFAGVVTAPINKLAMHMGGVDFPGHTEIFGEMTNADPFAMMMYSDRMAIGLVTCHQSLLSVPGSLTVERVAEVGRLLSDSVERIRGRKPRMAVLGVNPHAGEDALFGDEEQRIIAPAMEQLRREGYDVNGPLPPDTAFTERALREHGAHLCMYHDQGLIPFKMLCFDEGVNVTMGLPFVRTSPDHGTAYDIAGKGIAGTSSLLSAVKLAARLSSGSRA